jgi:DNA-binding MarR family transcriptional regulator
MVGSETTNISDTVQEEDPDRPGQVPKATAEALAAFRFLLRRFIRFSEERALKVGVTPQQYQLILAVEGQPGRDWATISDLAEALQIQHHAVVGLAQRCEDNGLVMKTRDSEDRRQVCVSLTEKGRSVFAAIARENLRELKDLLLSLEMLFHDGSVDMRQAEAAASTVSSLPP